MTITVKDHDNENYYISLDMEKGYNFNFYYSVKCYYKIKSRDGCEYLREREMSYPLSDKKKALATFNRYKRKYV